MERRKRIAGRTWRASRELEAKLIGGCPSQVARDKSSNYGVLDVEV